jgi:cell division protein FtsI/penicillin-binding protein 2
VSNPRRPVALVALIALVVATLAACTSSSKSHPDRDAAQSFLAALGRGDAPTASALTTDPAAATTALMASLTGLGSGAKGTFTVADVTSGPNHTATATYQASWTLPGANKPWTYQASLPLTKPAKAWQVSWSAHDIYPGLGTGQHLSAVRTQPTRAELLDSAGHPLFSKQPVVVVGINPAGVKDLTGLAATLAKTLGVSAKDIVTSVKAAPIHQFVPVITLRAAAYAAVKPKIHDLPGTQFQEDTELLGPSTNFAQPLLGSVGPATAQIVADSKGTVQDGDVTGLSGLQLALNTQLAGTPGISIYAADANDQTGAKPLATVTPPKPGPPVHLTLDSTTQAAAETALAGVTAQASVVVTQPSTGKVLAVANTPATNGLDIAVDGEYPPGSTFKIVTYTAAFTADPSLTPASTGDCPATMTVNGQIVRNEDNFAHGTIPLSDAFAYSCNTTAATLGLKLPAGALVKAARSLGLGATWTLPVPSFSGSLPEPSGASAVNEKAADAYGQGRVLVSPLLMAEIAGAAASGKPVAPSLVVGQAASPGAAQPATITKYLNTVMRDVVTVPGATGRALNDLPGPVQGKTGTAEYGTEIPPQSHSWFAGTRGDLALSVFIYGGGNSDSADGAVSVAHTLLRQLP